MTASSYIRHIIFSISASVVLIAILSVFMSCSDGFGDRTDSEGDVADGGSADIGGDAQSVDGTETGDDDKEFVMYVYINGNRLLVTLEDNSSTRELVRLLSEHDIDYAADDYGGFEKVGYIGHDLPRNDVAMRVSAGDVILYQGNNICLYYGNNSWTFTRLGRIDGFSQTELRKLLGAGDGSLRVRLSLK